MWRCLCFYGLLGWTKNNSSNYELNVVIASNPFLLTFLSFFVISRHISPILFVSFLIEYWHLMEIVLKANIWSHRQLEFLYSAAIICHNNHNGKLNEKKNKWSNLPSSNLWHGHAELSTKLGHCIRSDSKKCDDDQGSKSGCNGCCCCRPNVLFTLSACAKGVTLLITPMIIAYRMKRFHCNNCMAIICIRNRCPNSWYAHLVDDVDADDDNDNDDDDDVSDNGNRNKSKSQHIEWFAFVIFGWSSQLLAHQIVIIVC